MIRRARGDSSRRRVISRLAFAPAIVSLAIAYSILATGNLDGARLEAGLGAVIMSLDEDSGDLYIGSWSRHGIYRLRKGAGRLEHISPGVCRPIGMGWSSVRGAIV